MSMIVLSQIKVSLLPKWWDPALPHSFWSSPLRWTLILCQPQSRTEGKGGYGTLPFWLRELLFWLSGLWKHISPAGLTQLWSKAVLRQLNPVSFALKPLGWTVGTSAGGQGFIKVRLLSSSVTTVSQQAATIKVRETSRHCTSGLSIATKVA